MSPYSDNDINKERVETPGPSRLMRFVCSGIAAASWCYLAIVLACWASIRLVSDPWWPSLLLQLGPRWLSGFPLLLLVPAAAIIRRRSLPVLLLAALIVLLPLSGFCLPWRRAWPNSSVIPGALRVMTCNIHGRAANQKALFNLIVAEKPDIVALEECDGSFRRTETNGGADDEAQWFVSTDGELHIESRYPVRKLRNAFGGKEWAGGTAVLWEVQTPQRVFPLLVVHLISPHKAIDDVMHLRPFSTKQAQINATQRREQAAVLGQLIRSLSGSVICVGDFNMTSDTPSFTDHFAGLNDCFSSGVGFGFGWTYRTRWTTTRVDHALIANLWRCRRCWVGPDIGSPHRPLLAEIEPTTTQ